MYFPSHYKEKAAWGSEETASYREKVHEANTIMQEDGGGKVYNTVTVYTVSDRSCTLVLVHIQLAIQCKKKNTFLLDHQTQRYFCSAVSEVSLAKPTLSFSLSLDPQGSETRPRRPKTIYLSSSQLFLFFLNSRSPRGVPQPWLLAEPGQHPRGPRRLLRVQGQGEPAAPQARVDAQRK